MFKRRENINMPQANKVPEEKYWIWLYVMKTAAGRKKDIAHWTILPELAAEKSRYAAIMKRSL